MVAIVAIWRHMPSVAWRPTYTVVTWNIMTVMKIRMTNFKKSKDGKDDNIDGINDDYQGVVSRLQFGLKRNALFQKILVN